MNILELPNLKNIMKAKEVSDKDVFRFVFEDGTVGCAYYSRINNGDEMGFKSEFADNEYKDSGGYFWGYCLNSGNACEIPNKQNVEVMEHEVRIIGVDYGGENNWRSVLEDKMD